MLPKNLHLKNFFIQPNGVVLLGWSLHAFGDYFGCASTDFGHRRTSKSEVQIQMNIVLRSFRFRGQRFIMKVSSVVACDNSNELSLEQRENWRILASLRAECLRTFHRTLRRPPALWKCPVVTTDTGVSSRVQRPPNGISSTRTDIVLFERLFFVRKCTATPKSFLVTFPFAETKLKTFRRVHCLVQSPVWMAAKWPRTSRIEFGVDADWTLRLLDAAQWTFGEPTGSVGSLDSSQGNSGEKLDRLQRNASKKPEIVQSNFKMPFSTR